MSIDIRRAREFVSYSPSGKSIVYWKGYLPADRRRNLPLNSVANYMLGAAQAGRLHLIKRRVRARQPEWFYIAIKR